MKELSDECHHCGGTMALKRVVLESGVLWFHRGCYDRWARYGAGQYVRALPQPEELDPATSGTGEKDK